MEKVLDFAPCGYISFKDDGTVLSVNQTLTDLLTTSKVELVGKNIESILTVASRIFYNTHLFPILKLHDKAEEIFISLRGGGKEDIPVLLNAKRKNTGPEYVNELILMPIHQRRKYEDELLAAKRNAENAIRENQHLLTLTNELETKTAELDQQYSRLLQINREHFQFSKVLSHDLQETLHKMSVFSDKLSIEESGHLSDKGKEMIAKITKAILKANDLIIGLHHFIQVNEEEEFTNVDLNNVVTEAKAKAAKTLGFNDFEIDVSKLPVIHGIDAQLEELFYQLISNSVHYRDAKRQLKITISHTMLKENKYQNLSDKYDFTDHVRIIFKDNGVGFDSTLNNYVFSLFKKIHFSSTGLGIGLAIARKITEKHAGSISVNSTPGVGTEVVVLLPLTK
jgi:sigma-B regulation protein RsbU (phosphoserine phosphatase)